MRKLFVRPCPPQTIAAAQAADPQGFPVTVQVPPAAARLKDAARRSRGRPGRPVLDPRRVGRLWLGMTDAGRVYHARSAWIIPLAPPLHTAI